MELDLYHLPAKPGRDRYYPYHTHENFYAHPKFKQVLDRPDGRDMMVLLIKLYDLGRPNHGRVMLNGRCPDMYELARDMNLDLDFVDRALGLFLWLRLIDREMVMQDPWFLDMLLGK